MNKQSFNLFIVHTIKKIAFLITFETGFWGAKKRSRVWCCWWCFWVPRGLFFLVASSGYRWRVCHDVMSHFHILACSQAFGRGSLSSDTCYTLGRCFLSPLCATLSALLHSPPQRRYVFYCISESTDIPFCRRRALLWKKNKTWPMNDKNIFIHTTIYKLTPSLIF